MMIKISKNESSVLLIQFVKKKARQQKRKPVLVRMVKLLRLFDKYHLT